MWKNPPWTRTRGAGLLPSSAAAEGLNTLSCKASTASRGRWCHTLTRCAEVKGHTVRFKSHSCYTCQLLLEKIAVFYPVKVRKQRWAL